MKRATTAGTGLLVALALAIAGAQSRARYIPYSEARPILEALRAALLPTDLRGKSETELQAAWPRWVSHRDTEIRARLAEGDEDSVINFLLFGVTFTLQSRTSARFSASAACRRTRRSLSTSESRRRLPRSKRIACSRPASPVGWRSSGPVSISPTSVRDTISILCRRSSRSRSSIH